MSWLEEMLRSAISGRDQETLETFVEIAEEGLATAAPSLRIVVFEARQALAGFTASPAPLSSAPLPSAPPAPGGKRVGGGGRDGRAAEEAATANLLTSSDPSPSVSTVPAAFVREIEEEGGAAGSSGSASSSSGGARFRRLGDDEAADLEAAAAASAAPATIVPPPRKNKLQAWEPLKAGEVAATKSEETMQLPAVHNHQSSDDVQVGDSFFLGSCAFFHNQAFERLVLCARTGVVGLQAVRRVVHLGEYLGDVGGPGRG